MKKNILFIDHHAELGGGEIALLEIIKNLDRRRFHPLAVLGDGGPLQDELGKLDAEAIVDKLPGYFRQLDRDPEKKNKLTAFIRSAFCLPIFIKNIKSVITEKNIDVVYINSIKSSLYGIPAARQTKCRIIWHLHDCLTRDFYSLWIIPLIIFLTNRADKIICVSDAVKKYFIKAGGNPNKAVVIYNGVDLERFNPNISGEFVKKQLGLSGQRIVSMIGRLESWKGQRVFIKAAKIISEKRDDIIFLIVGGPLFGFAEYEKELKTMVEQLGLKNKVLFLGFRAGPKQIYAGSDVIVHCSVKPEPFGRDIIETMACGKPVISTELGAPGEIIEDKKDGVLIKPNNPKLLANKILKLIDNPRAARILGANAREKAEEQFDIADIAGQVEELL